MRAKRGTPGNGKAAGGLPLAEAPLPPPEAASTGRVSVLLVDDHLEDLMALEAILGELDVDLVKASSGEEALHRLLDRDFSAILLDVRMPGLNGFETAELIRQRDRSASVPIIFLTGVDTAPASQFKGYSIGAVDYILKPFSPEILRSKVSVFVDLAQAVQRVREQAKQLQRLEEREHRRMLDEVTDQRNRIFSLALDLMCIARFDGFLVELNPTWESTLGWTKSKMLGRPFLEFIHPEDRAEAASVWEKLKTDPGTIHFEIRVSCADGSYRWLSWKGTSYPKEELIYAVARDVSELKKSAEEVRRLNVELEARVAERTVQLQAANRELESFSYSVSHDLRAPLRAIEGFSRRLAGNYGPGLDEEGNRLIDIVVANTRKMGQLIDDLLAFSRMGRAELRKELVAMGDLARETSDELTQGLGGRRVEVRIGEMPPAWGDRSLLRQVFVNLVGNAVKYTRPCEMAEIEIGSVVENGETAYFIRDNGVGFDPAYTHKLFGVFQRLHASEQFEGTGVGLALVQRIIHRHGGRIRAAGKPGEGATFHFSLPEDAHHHANR